jgi:hypothetical protein
MSEFDSITCPDCGDVHRHIRDAEVTEAAVLTSAEVEIARINAKRDVDLAKLSRGLVENEVLIEAAIESAHAEGEADGLREAIAPPELEPAEDAEPIVIAQVNTDDSDEGLEAPPEDEAGHHEARRSRGIGMW